MNIYESPVQALSFVTGELNRTDAPSAQWTKLQSRLRAYGYARSLEDDWQASCPISSLSCHHHSQERVDIIKRVHHKIGHLGRDWTHLMVSRYYILVACMPKCLQCDRVRSTSSVNHDRLKPMPFFGHVLPVQY